MAVDGTYLYRLPVASFESSNTDAFQPQKYFDKLERQMVSYEAVRYDGSTETLTVPVSYNPATGRYYLMDPERLIAVGDFYTVVYGGDMDFISSDDPSVWRNGDVLAYDRYIKAYDFYAGLGPAQDCRYWYASATATLTGCPWITRATAASNTAGRYSAQAM